MISSFLSVPMLFLPTFTSLSQSDNVMVSLKYDLETFIQNFILLLHIVTAVATVILSTEYVTDLLPWELFRSPSPKGWRVVWLCLMCFRYTYGKPVKGTVTVTCLSVSYWTNKRNITTTMEVSPLLAVSLSLCSVMGLMTLGIIPECEVQLESVKLSLISSLKHLYSDCLLRMILGTCVPFTCAWKLFWRVPTDPGRTFIQELQ